MQKMVFVAGPRQVGKTTLAKQFLKPTNLGYLNWDISNQREHILKHELPNTSLWVFDEIHKYRNWRNYLKGIYDEYATTHQILVTGSAKLDYYRQRLIEDDLVKLEQVRDLGTLELLMLRLPHLVGSPLSINSLREDLQVSHKTVSNWLDIFVRLYAIFRLSPFGAPSLRAVKKEQKHYHFDWTLIENVGPRFENMVALHLLKWVHFLQDTEARELELRYFRDIDGREVDFIVTDKTKPILAIECKWDDAEISPGLKYFKLRFPECSAWQLIMVGSKDYLSKDGIQVCTALKFLRTLI